MKLILALILSIMGTASARAACTPSQAKPGMAGCQPRLALPLQSTDLLQMWRGSDYPTSAETASVQDILNYLAGVNVFTSLTTGSLAVTGNGTIGANLTVNGNLNATAFNNTSTLGYQIGGRTALFLTPTNIPADGTGTQQGVFIGPKAGEYFAKNNIPARFGMTAVGTDSLQFLQDLAAETVCVGQFTCRVLQHTYGVTAVGQSVMTGESFSGALYATCVGNDCMRDTVGNLASTGVGAESQRDGVGNSNTSNGAFSMRGNAGSILAGGTPGTGSVWHFAFVTTNANTTGLPATVTYTVPTGATLESISVGIAAAINSQLHVGYLMPDGVDMIADLGLSTLAAAFVGIIGGPPIVAFHWFGGDTTGMAIGVTPSCVAGPCTESMTVNAPYSGHDNIATGVKSLQALALGSGSFNHAKGTASLANLSGSSSGVQCDGYQSCLSALTGGSSYVGGVTTLQNSISITNSIVIAPGLQGTANAVLDSVIIGGDNGQSACFGTLAGVVSLGYGDCPLSSSENWQLSIQRGAIAGRNNNKGAGGPGGGQIGVEIASAAVMNATFTISDYGGAATYGSHFRVHQTTAPALSACGTTPAADATASDTAGTVTEGTTATGCTITFTTAYATTPHCSVSNWAGNAQAVTLSACSTTALTVTNSSGTGNKFTYQVIQ